MSLSSFGGDGHQSVTWQSAGVSGKMTFQLLFQSAGRLLGPRDLAMRACLSVKQQMSAQATIMVSKSAGAHYSENCHFHQLCFCSPIRPCSSATHLELKACILAPLLLTDDSLYFTHQMTFCVVRKMGLLVIMVSLCAYLAVNTETSDNHSVVQILEMREKSERGREGTVRKSKNKSLSNVNYAASSHQWITISFF